MGFEPMNGRPLRGFRPRQIIHSCTSHQSPRADLNRLPRPYRERALPAELQGHDSEATERIGLSLCYFADSRLPIWRCGHVSNQVGMDGFEPSTPCFRRRCASGLRYIPRMVPPARFGLAAFRLRGGCSSRLSYGGRGFR